MVQFFAPALEVFRQPLFAPLVKILFYGAFVYVPFFLILAVYKLMGDYHRALYYAQIPWVLLEIKIPKDVFKSPRAMEFVIAGMSKPDYERNWYEKWWKGSTRQDFSLEIASIHGEIHFFIWTRKEQQRIIEGNLYSQYPGIEVFEVPDYTKQIVYDPKTMGLIAFEFDLVKPDVYPIRTYIDWGMDKDPKEEYKIDPLTPLLEYMGSFGRGQIALFQIMLRRHMGGESKVKEYDSKVKEEVEISPGNKKLIYVEKTIDKSAKDEIKKIEDAAKQKLDEEGKPIPGSGRFLNDTETDIIKSIWRKVSKNAFDVGIRIIYMAPKEIYSGGHIGGMVGGMMHFNANNFNSFKAARTSPDIRPFFKKFGFNVARPDRLRNPERQEMLDAYKRRSYFYPPHVR